MIQICLDVKTASGLRLVDSFQWDICNPDNIPEEFAALLVADMAHSSLPGLTGRQLSDL